MATRAQLDLVDLATRQQVYLERYKAGLVKKSRETLQQLDKMLVEIVAALDKDLTDLSRAELLNLQADVKKATIDVSMQVLDDLTPQLAELADYSVDLEVKTLKQATKKETKVKSADATKAFKASLKDPIGATGETLDSFMQGWTKKQGEAVSKLIGKGYSNGWTNQQLIQAIRGTKKNGFKDGIVETAARNAESVVRTAVQQVASDARFATWNANSDILAGYRIIATLDGDTTVMCRTLDQQVFEIGKGPKPPFHIRCRTTTVAEIKPEFRSILPGGGTRAAKGEDPGPVKGSTTYYEWLKTQSPGFQDSVIGPMRGKLLRDGGLSAQRFSELQLHTNFEPATLDDMRKLEPLAFERAGLN